MIELRSQAPLLGTRLHRIEVAPARCARTYYMTPYANETRLRSYFGMISLDDELRQHLHQHWAALADTYMDEQGVNLLMAHLFVMKRGGEQPEESDDERSILQVGGASVVYTDMIPPQIQYTALGHLHRYQQMQAGLVLLYIAAVRWPIVLPRPTSRNMLFL